MAQTLSTNRNRGQVSVHGGYRIRLSAEGLHVVYLRARANQHLPRSFTWTDAAAVEDLHRYLNGLITAQDHVFVRDCQQRGFVRDMTYITADAQSALRSLCRASLAWMAAVMQGSEPLSVPTRARIHLRTDRNGLIHSRLPAQCVEHGILTVTETRGRPPVDLSHRLHDTPMEVLARTPWEAGAAAPLVLCDGRLLQSGFLFAPTTRGWRASAVIPGRVGHVKSFIWRGGERWDRLARVLAAMRQQRHVTLARMTERSTLIEEVEIEQAEHPADTTEVSPARLGALLRGEDPLQLPCAELCTWVQIGHRWYPRHFDPRLVDRTLNELHALAVRARDRLGLPVACAHPIPVTQPMTDGDGASDFVSQDFSGPNLLTYGRWTQIRRHHAFAHGDLPGASPVSEIDARTFDGFAIASRRMHWPPYGNGTVRYVFFQDSPVWMAWRSDTEGSWSVLAQQWAMLIALEAGCGISPTLVAAGLDG